MMLKTRNGDIALFDQLMDTFFELPTPRFAYAGNPLDLYEWNGKYVVELSVPGFEPKEIDVEVTGNTVTISGTHVETEDKKDVKWHRREMRRGAFTRTVVLPQDLDPATIKAFVEKGILRLELTPIVPIAPKKIEVKSG